MINIKIITVGQLKEKYFLLASQEYLKRLSKYCKIELVEVKDEPILNKSSPKEDLIVLKKEGEKVLSKIKDQDFVILLDLDGIQFDSIALSKKIEEHFVHSSELTFVIGGSLGTDIEVKKRANLRWCLSKLTFPHNLARIILLEQIYRVFKILNNETYHK